MDVREISKQDAKILIEKYHYLGDRDFRCKVAYGLFDNDRLVGVAVFHSVSAPETVVGLFGLERDEQDGIYELGRFVLHPDYNGHNNATWFLSRAIKIFRQTYDVGAILTYADSDYHVGKIYQAYGFDYYGLTAPKKDFWVQLSDGSWKIKHRGKTRGIKGEWRPRSRKHRYLRVYWNRLKSRIKWKKCPYPK